MAKAWIKAGKNRIKHLVVYGCWEAEIPALKVSWDSAVVSFYSSWFHSLIFDGKKDSLYVLVLQYETLYLNWWPLVAAPKDWRCGEAGIATMACTVKPANTDTPWDHRKNPVFTVC